MSRPAQQTRLNVALMPATPISRERLGALAKLADAHPLTLQAHRAGLPTRRATRVRIEHALALATEIDSAIGLPAQPDPHDVRFIAAVERVIADRTERSGGQP